MYIPKHFAVDDQEKVMAFVQANAFGQLISHNEGGLCSSHLPFFLSEDHQTLTGHLARVNPQSQAINGQQVLITLQGPHDYISPAWYIKQGVPTWNYQAVHIYGDCVTFDDPGKLATVVDALTDKYESARAEPWKSAYPPAMLNAIVGFEVSITSIEAQFKLSQNKPAPDRHRVIDALNENGASELASAMENEL